MEICFGEWTKRYSKVDSRELSWVYYSGIELDIEVGGLNIGAEIVLGVKLFLELYWEHNLGALL